MAIGASNRADGSVQSDRVESLQNGCIDLLLKSIFRSPSAHRKKVAKGLLLLEAPESFLLKIIARLPYFVGKESRRKEYFPDRFRVKKSIDRFEELGKVNELFCRLIKKRGTVRLFVNALQERYGPLFPFTDVDDLVPFESDLDLRELEPYPSYDQAQELLGGARVYSIDHYLVHHAQNVLRFRDLPLHPDRVYSHPGYGGRWTSSDAFFRVGAVFDRIILSEGEEKVRFLSYSQAKSLLERRGVRHILDYFKVCKDESNRLPYYPNLVYLDEFASWGEFLDSPKSVVGTSSLRNWFFW